MHNKAHIMKVAQSSSLVCNTFSLKGNLSFIGLIEIISHREGYERKEDEGSGTSGQEESSSLWDFSK